MFFSCFNAFMDHSISYLFSSRRKKVGKKFVFTTRVNGICNLKAYKNVLIQHNSMGNYMPEKKTLCQLRELLMIFFLCRSFICCRLHRRWNWKWQMMLGQEGVMKIHRQWPRNISQLGTFYSNKCDVLYCVLHIEIFQLQLLPMLQSSSCGYTAAASRCSLLISNSSCVTNSQSEGEKHCFFHAT